MKKSSHHRRPHRPQAFLLLSLILLLLSCGEEKKQIPKEESGEPNTVPVELQQYREARSVFRSWVKLFHRPREADAAYSLLSSASIRRLSRAGVRSADDFGSWIASQEAGGRAPFIYEFSRFDILDIDVRDSTRAVITASFLVHRHQNTFESVSSFFLKRENGSWKVPFAESGNYESSWWQKEKNFLARLREEGMATFQSDSLGITFSYPMTWDIASAVPIDINALPALHGIELQYIDPASMQPAAIVRIATLPPVAPSSPDSSALPDSSAMLSVLSTVPVATEHPLPMQGTLQMLSASPDGSRIAFLALVADDAAFARFRQTFQTIRKSIFLNNEIYP
jgi:hypothetical protein